jgi:hypothetical protein
MSTKKMKLTALSTALGLAVALTLQSCLPAARPSDAGHYSFARQIVPTLLGRKVKGYDEIKLLADLSRVGGREKVVRALMAQPEFVDQWSEILVDQLRINRVTPGAPKYQGECFGAPLRSGSDGGSLARWVRNHPPTASGVLGGSFNMSDLLRSSLELDDLSPAYRAYLFPLVNSPIDGNQITEMNKRDDLGVNFGHVYIHRQMLCLTCHSSDASISGAGSGWNRTHPIPGSFEQAVYGPGYVSIDTRRTNTLFRTDVAREPRLLMQPPPTTAELRLYDQQPWGMSAQCGVFRRTVDPDLPANGLPAGQTGYFIGDRGRIGSVWDVESALAVGYSNLARDGVVRTGNDNNHDGFPDTIEGDSAFAFLVAANAVNQTWTEVMGYPVTIANYYPRNADQRGVLWHLSEVQFIQHHWSLRNVLEKIVLSEFYNREPPQASGGASAYELPMVYDPWVAADPRVVPTPADDARFHNSMGDDIHRHSPRSLFYSIHAALDWPTPKRFPDASYPSEDLMKSMGQFIKDAEPGFRGVDFQGLLMWESNHRAGAKPSDVATDWVDRLLGEITGFDAANPTNPAKLSDVVMTTKDWLLGEAEIRSGSPGEESVGERQALEAFFGVTSLDTTRAAAVSELETKLRRYVGVLLESPQFMLAGIAPRNLGQRPRLRVCNNGPCTYQQLCEALQPAYQDQGYMLTCEADSVSIAPYVNLSINLRDLSRICPRGLCGFMLLPDSSHLCMSGRSGCGLQPPRCDPRCNRIDCCGGLPPPLDRPSAMLAWAEGGVVQRAEGVRFLPKGGEFQILTTNTILHAGDLLLIAPKGRLVVETKEGRFSTPGAGMPPHPLSLLKAQQQKKTETQGTDAADANWVFIVTGPSILAPPQKPGSPLLRTQQEIDRILDADAIRFGEAGPPSPPDAKQKIDERRMNPNGQKPVPLPTARPTPKQRATPP